MAAPASHGRHRARLPKPAVLVFKIQLFVLVALERQRPKGLIPLGFNQLSHEPIISNCQPLLVRCADVSVVRLPARPPQPRGVHDSDDRRF